MGLWQGAGGERAVRWTGHSHVRAVLNVEAVVLVLREEWIVGDLVI